MVGPGNFHAPAGPCGYQERAPGTFGEPGDCGRGGTGRSARQGGPRVTHFRPVFRFSGPRSYNNNKTSALATGASPLVPALLPPAAAWASPGSAPRRAARGVGRTTGRALRPPFPAETVLPRETRVGPWPPLSSRKGAAAAEDARPDCAAGGSGGGPRGLLSVRSPVEPGGADLAGNAAPTAEIPDPAAATVHHPWCSRWPLYGPMHL